MPSRKEIAKIITKNIEQEISEINAQKEELERTIEIKRNEADTNEQEGKEYNHILAEAIYLDSKRLTLLNKVKELRDELSLLHDPSRKV